jgi:lipopolysaccharide transport system permease protein
MVMERLKNLKNIWHVDLLVAMTEKEIKARYKGAIFGFLWLLLNPVMQMLVIGVVFRYVTKTPIENYFVFLFAGLLPWNFFSYSTVKNTPMIVNERYLIKKAYFPREILIYALILANLFHLVITVLIFGIVLLLFGLLKVSILLPVAILWLLLLTTGTSLFFATWNVQFRDINFFVQAIIPLWFYATPIVYLLSFVPDNLKLLFYINPMTGIVEMFRSSLLGVDVTMANGLWLSLFSSIVIIVLGLVSFLKKSPYFDDWI